MHAWEQSIFSFLKALNLGLYVHKGDSYFYFLLKVKSRATTSNAIKTIKL